MKTLLQQIFFKYTLKFKLQGTGDDKEKGAVELANINVTLHLTINSLNFSNHNTLFGLPHPLLTLESRIWGILSRVPGRPFPGRQMSRIFNIHNLLIYKHLILPKTNLKAVRLRGRAKSTIDIISYVTVVLILCMC